MGSQLEINTPKQDTSFDQQIEKIDTQARVLKQQLVDMVNQKLDIEYQRDLSKADSFYTKEKKIDGVTKTVKVMKYTSYFEDEETDEKVAIPRELIVEVDGAPSFHTKLVSDYYLTIDDEITL